MSIQGLPLVLCCILLGMGAAHSGELKPWSGGATPALALRDPLGKPQDLAAYRGKVVLVNFWATWCEPCREEMPSLARLATRWQAQGLTVLTVAVADNAKRVEEFLWEALPDQQTLPVLHDRDQVISRAWEARMLPTTVILNKQHRIVARGTGAIDWDAPAIDKQLKKLIN